MVDELLALFEQCLKDFYKDHIIPFLPLPYDERPGIEMVIGVRRSEQSSILVTDKTTIRQPFRPYVAIGKGGDYATMLVRRLLPLGRLPTAAEARVLAAYVVFRVKEAVETCGNYTTIVTLNRMDIIDADTPKPIEVAEYLPLKRVDEWERRFRDEWAREEQLLIWRLVKELATSSGS